MSSPLWFVTGASNGLGLLLALRVLRAGHRAIGTVRSRTRAAAAVSQIEELGGHVIELDMTEPQSSITAKVQAAVSAHGAIDYLVNNAAYSVLGAMEHFTAAEAELQMRTNFLGPLYTMQAALPCMRAAGRGTIVNVSSVAARDPQATSTLYSASKAALEAAAEGLAREVGPKFGIRVLIVEPGAFRTNFLAAFARPEAGVPEHYRGTAVESVLGMFEDQDGKQKGDPAKAADRIFEVASGAPGTLGGPLQGRLMRLVVGEDALARMRSNNDRFLADLELQGEVTRSTNF